MSLKKAILISVIPITVVIVLLLSNILTQEQAENPDYENPQPQTDENIIDEDIAEITEKKSLEFSISQGLKSYSIILDSKYLTDDIQDEKLNYYEFVSLGDFPSINSIELKALYHCTEENIQTQADYIILNYQSSATILFCENFLYSNNNTLMTYAIQDNKTSEYCFVCLLYDIENNVLCEFILEIGDIETFRVNSSNNIVKQMFENIYISSAHYKEIEEVLTPNNAGKNYETAFAYAPTTTLYGKSVSEIMDMPIIYNENEMLFSEWLKKDNLSVIKHSSIDMDGDGSKEIVLWLSLFKNEEFGSVILHEENETVYFYLLYYRQFYCLKNDGTFSASAGVANNGIGKISFSGATYTMNDIAYCESVDNENISYFIEGEAVSQEEFNAYEMKQQEKTDAVWNTIEITEEEIRQEAQKYTLNIPFPKEFEVEEYVVPVISELDEFVWGEYVPFVKFAEARYTNGGSLIHGYAFLTPDVKTIDEGKAIYKKFNDKYKITSEVLDGTFLNVDIKSDEGKVFREFLFESKIVNLSEDLTHLERLSFMLAERSGEDDLFTHMWQEKFEIIENGEVINTYKGNPSSITEVSSTNMWQKDEVSYEIPSDENSYAVVIDKVGDVVLVQRANEEKQKLYMYNLETGELNFLLDYAFDAKISPDLKYLVYTNFNWEFTLQESKDGFYIKNLEDGKTVFYPCEKFANYAWGNNHVCEGFVLYDSLIKEQ